MQVRGLRFKTERQNFGHSAQWGLMVLDPDTNFRVSVFTLVIRVTDAYADLWFSAKQTRQAILKPERTTQHQNHSEVCFDMVTVSAPL